ncbi:MAG TPA: serpin family protein [Propionicimonas sp.]|nr:serpin family protein [Propionicimonas sp.]
MTPRALLAGACLTALLLPLAAGCAGGTTSGTGEVSAAGVVMRQVTPDRATALPSVVEATRVLGTSLLQAVPEGNAVVSPSSLAVALAMLADGARGTTLSQLEAVLGASGEQRKDAFAALRGTLNSMDGDPAVVKQSELPEHPLVHLADQVVVDDGYQVSQDYLTALADGFGAGVQRADLASPAGKQVLSEWVNHHTGGLIKSSAIEPNPDLRLVLQDAILLAARWQTAFEQSATGDRAFTLTDGTSVDVETMASRTPVAYAEVDGWRAVRLPYVDGTVHADLILPPAGTDPGSIDPALLARLATALAAATPGEVELTLPTLDLAPDTLDLTATLRTVGVASVLCGEPDTDLTGMGPEQPCVQQAKQQAVLQVDEEGTKAAAVTEMGMAGTSAPMTPELVLHLDRPFLMEIAHTQTGWPLFLAAVRDPRH